MAILRLTVVCPHQTFYLGYYDHLLTDILWAQEIVSSLKEKRRRGISKNPQETIWKWKGDWYDLDFLYLKRDYIWLTQERMNAFVTYAAEIVLEKNNMIK